MPAVPPAPDHELQALYREHHAWLCGWLRRKLGGREGAADLAQDTFLRILGLQRREGDLALREPRAYLTRVASHVLVSHHRRCSLEQAWLAALASLPEAVAPSPEDRYIILETLHEIDTVLDALPGGVREVFLLSQLEGLGYAEIAGLQGISVRTVKRYMAQAFEACILAAV